MRCSTRADVISVVAVATPVLALEDVLVTMLCAIDEHSLDYSRLIAIARSLREQIDWASLRNRTAGSPYAEAFFTLVRRWGSPRSGQPTALRAASGSCAAASVRSTAAAGAEAAGPDQAWVSVAADLDLAWVRGRDQARAAAVRASAKGWDRPDRADRVAELVFPSGVFCRE